MNTYSIPVVVRPRQRNGKPTYRATMFIQAKDRASARQQLNRGVINAEVQTLHGHKARCHYDRRRMKLHSVN